MEKDDDHKNYVNIRWTENGRKHGRVVKLLNNKKQMVSALGHKKVSTEIMDVPADAKFTKLKKSQKEYFCMDEKPKPKIDGGLEVSEWEEHTRDKCLTIKDVECLRPGQKLKVVTLDRNVYDIAFHCNEPGKLHDAKHFYRENVATYTHKSDLKGKIKMDDVGKMDFEFDIEWAKDEWYPLTDGKLPEKDPQNFSDFPNNMLLDWKDYPKDTRIGYRGAMILLDKMDEMPKVYYYDW